MPKRRHEPGAGAPDAGGYADDGLAPMDDEALADATAGGALEAIRMAGPGMDLAFHAAAPLLAVGLITGGVRVFRYDESGYGKERKAPPAPAARVLKLKPHAGACRACRFANMGPGGADALLTAGSDGVIAAIDVAEQRVAAKLPDAHDDAINVLCTLPAASERSLIASGDDSGLVRIWDVRARALVAEYQAHEDYVSSLHVVSKGGGVHIVSGSGDGTVACADLRRALDGAARQGRALALKCKRTEEGGDEILSLALARGGERIVAGSAAGVLHFYTFGDWDAGATDRLPGHPDSIDAVVTLDGIDADSSSGDLAVTGCGDGLLRVINLLPNGMLGVLGEHGTSGMPVEVLAISDRGRHGAPGAAVLASASHDNTVRLWDAAEVVSEFAAARRALSRQKGAAAHDSDDSDSDDSDDSDGDDGDGPPRPAASLRGRGKRALRATRTSANGASASTSARAAFFADL